MSNEDAAQIKEEMPIPPRIEIKPPIELKQKESGGLVTKINDIDSKLNAILGTKSDKELKKHFKIPGSLKGKLKKIAKENKAQVILLRENKNILPTIGEIKEGMLIVNNKMYNGAADVYWLWNGKIPTAIVKEWDLNPISATKERELSETTKSSSYPQTLIIRAMELKEVMGKQNPFSGKMLIWILIGAAVVGYILFANQKGG